MATKMSPEVAADTAEPPGVVVHAAVFPGATPAAVSPEVAADAAEPTEAAVLPLIPCMVVAPSNALAACHITIKGTITELTVFVETPDGTAVEPLEVAASTAEPPEVSVVSTYQLLPCPVTAKKAVCELSPCPVTAKEAVCKLSPCPVTAKEAVCELSPCHVTAKKAVCELSPCPVTAKEAVCELSPCPVTAKKAVCELSPCPVTAKEAVCELSPCPVTTKRAVCELSPCPVTAMEAAYESSSCPITAMKAVYELPGCSVPATEATLEPLPCSEPAEEAITGLSLCPELAKVSEVEPFVCPISICESVFCPTSPVTTPKTLPKLSLGSSSPVTAQRPAVELLTLSVMNFEPINALPVLSMSRILSMHFRSFTTRGHSLTTLTLALHELLHTITKYNSHHPLALTSHS